MCRNIGALCCIVQIVISNYNQLHFVVVVIIVVVDPLAPLGHIWDYVMLAWRKNCLCATVLSTIIMVHRSVDWIRLYLAWFSSPSSSVSACMVFVVLYIYTVFQKKHVTTFLMISWSRTVRLERFLAYLLLRVQAIDMYFYFSTSPISCSYFTLGNCQDLNISKN